MDLLPSRDEQVPGGRDHLTEGCLVTCIHWGFKTCLLKTVTNSRGHLDKAWLSFATSAPR